MIPETFHMTLKDKTDIPPRFKKNLDRIAELYPDHEVRLHDDDDIDRFFRSADPAYYDAVIRRMPSFIMVVDTVRYMWMRELGGTYADMDVFFRRRVPQPAPVQLLEREWTHPVDPAITHSVHNCYFGSEPGHAMWDDILEGIAQNVSRLRPEGVLAGAADQVRRQATRVLVRLDLRPRALPPVFNATGPNAISKIITDRRLLERHPEVEVLTAEHMFQKDYSSRESGGEDLVHETAASWAG